MCRILKFKLGLLVQISLKRIFNSKSEYDSGRLAINFERKIQVAEVMLTTNDL